MRRPAVFFDRDNTLIVGNEYLGDPDKVVLVDGASSAIARCRELGFATVVVSNQSGVARGMFDEDAVRTVNAKMDALLLEGDARAVIDRHEFCPFHPDGVVEHYRQDSFLRKPKPGMILAASESLALDLSRSWLVGDAPRDIAAGKAAGCQTVLVIDPTHPPSPAAAEASTVEPDHVATSLTEAVDIIQRLHQQIPPEPSDPHAQKTESHRLAPAKGPEPVLSGTAVIKPMEPPEMSPPVRTASPPGDSKARSEAQIVDAFRGSPSAAPPVDSTKPTPRREPLRVEPITPAAPLAAPVAPPAARSDFARLELLNQQILMELKRANEQRHDDFSISKLVAGIAQVVLLLPLVLAYLNWANTETAMKLLLLALFLETMAVAFLIMGRQK